MMLLIIFLLSVSENIDGFKYFDKISISTMSDTINYETGKRALAWCINNGEIKTIINWSTSKDKYKIYTSANLKFSTIEIAASKNSSIECYGYDAYGRIITKTINLNFLQKNSKIPQISDKPQHYTGNQSQNYLYCNASGDKPLRILWFKDYEQLTTLNASINGDEIVLNSSGRYFCIAINSHGFAVSDDIQLSLDLKISPYFLNYFDDTYVVKDEKTIYCKVGGIPKPTTFWISDKSGIFYRDVLHVSKNNSNEQFMCVASSNLGIILKKIEIISYETYKSFFEVKAWAVTNSTALIYWNAQMNSPKYWLYIGTSRFSYNSKRPPFIITNENYLLVKNLKRINYYITLYTVVGETKVQNLPTWLNMSKIYFYSQIYTNVTNITHSSFKIKWKIFQKRDVEGYKLFIKELKSLYWEKILTITEEEYIFHNLLPNTRYKLSIATITKSGDGPYLKFIIVTTGKHTPSNSPLIVSIFTIGSTGIKVNWLPLGRPEESISYYSLYWRENNSTNSEKLNLKNMDPQTTIIRNLKPSTQYEIYSSTFNEFGEGPRSKSKYVTTPGKSSYTSANITLKVTSPTSVLIHWKKEYGENNQHRLIFYCENEGNNNFSIYDNIVSIGNLSKNCRFNVKLATFDSGEYKFSEANKYILYRGPEPPRIRDCLRITEDIARINFIGVYDKLKILCSQMDLNTTTINLETNANNINISGLISGKSYLCNVQAQQFSVMGEMSRKIIINSEIYDKLIILKYSALSRSVNIEIKKPQRIDVKNYIFVYHGYKSFYNEFNKLDYVNYSKTIILAPINISSNNFNLSDLIPYTTYSFTVNVKFSDEKLGTPSNFIFFTAESAPPSLQSPKISRKENKNLLYLNNASEINGIIQYSILVVVSDELLEENISSNNLTLNLINYCKTDLCLLARWNKRNIPPYIEIGDEMTRGGYKNIKLSKLKNYRFFIRYFVNDNTYGDSKVSKVFSLANPKKGKIFFAWYYAAIAFGILALLSLIYGIAFKYLQKKKRYSDISSKKENTSLDGLLLKSTKQVSMTPEPGVKLNSVAHHNKKIMNYTSFMNHFKLLKENEDMLEKEFKSLQGRKSILNEYIDEDAFVMDFLGRKSSCTTLNFFKRMPNIIFNYIDELRINTVISLGNSSQIIKYMNQLCVGRNDDFCLEMTNKVVLADFTHCRFNIQKKNENISFNFFHLHNSNHKTWNTSTFIQFITRVRQYYINFPSDVKYMIIHNSDEINFAAIYLIIDNVMNAFYSKNMTNILEYAGELQNKYPLAISNKYEYLLLYEISVEIMQVSTHILNINKITNSFIESRNFENEFQRLNEHSAYSVYSNRTDFEEISKNNRFRQSRTLAKEEETFVNECYVDSFARFKSILVVPCPLEDKLNEFFKMIWKSKTKILVILCCFQNHGKKQCTDIWHKTLMTEYGEFKVEQLEETATNQYILKIIKISEIKSGEYFVFSQYYYTKWSKYSVIDINKFVQFTQEIMEINNFESSSPLTVICSSGSDRCGVFIVLFNLLQQTHYYGNVDIMGTVIKLRQQKKGTINAIAQYHFCYKAMLEMINLRIDV